MNVCLISREYPPFFGGGIGTYNVQWAKALAAAGHKVLVITASPDGTEQRESAGGITVIRLPFLRGEDWSSPHPNIDTPEVRAIFRAFHPILAFSLQVERALPRLAQEFGIDIIEVPDTGAIAWFGLNNRRMGGSWRDVPPVVTTIHSPTAWIAHYNRAPMTTRAFQEMASMERDAAQWSDALLSPSTALAEWTIENWGVSRAAIETIPYPLGDLETASGTPRPPAHEFRVLFIGRLEARKGVDTLLAAAARTADIALKLDLVGEDTEDPERPGLFGRNSLERLVPQEKRAAIRLLGKKSPAELPALRDSADAIVIPSPMDNFPFVCVEAMAEGRLVIASDAGGTGEMIRDGVDGFLFPPGDVDACASAIERAAGLSASERKTIRDSAAQRIRDYCGNAPILARRIQHYSQTIAKAKSRAAAVDSGEVLVINGAGLSDSTINHMKAALLQSGSDFAHAWVRVDGELHAFSTPSLRTLGMAPRALGPLIVRREALRRAMPNGLMYENGKGLRAVSTWSLALELCASGARGLCIHDLVIDVPRADMHPVDRALIDELDAIHDSRGWRVMNRLYDALHILRGRGLRRPYNPRRRSTKA